MAYVVYYHCHRLIVCACDYYRVVVVYGRAEIDWHIYLLVIHEVWICYVSDYDQNYWGGWRIVWFECAYQVWAWASWRNHYCVIYFYLTVVCAVWDFYVWLIEVHCECSCAI